MTTKKFIVNFILSAAVLISSVSFAAPGPHQHGHWPSGNDYHPSAHPMERQGFAPHHYHPVRHRHHHNRYPFRIIGGWFR